MNILSKILDVAVAKGIFHFHPKCHRIGMTHLYFADDLLISCKGTLDSVIGVQSVLSQFYLLSGSELFATGIQPMELERIQRISGFKLGRLPVRYLAVRIVTRKLTEKDCQPLIAKIRARIGHWSSRRLSCAGRLQLIQAVLFNISNYWCKQLILLKAVIHKINQMCTRIFRKGTESSATGAKISWNQICSLKSEGGLGLKDLYSWNKACILQLIRNILAGEGSLWVARIRAYITKDADFGQFECRSNMSWCLMKLFKMRDEATQVQSMFSDPNKASMKQNMGSCALDMKEPYFCTKIGKPKDNQ
ncbi:hypothetical protein CXB51_024231 [Gossypium anomalum]|uniref:Reverse transcriptase domain-containing protein n=1 Tax=Gossypium anomalum TaxID=47600 RepID=A0A8J6CT56_9ROSI|nr:hypothetical protein CXB51_024231 [Gossypium anomalum]